MEIEQCKYNYDFLFKIVLVGDIAVGKSNILSRFTREDFQIDNTSTIGVEFANRVITAEDKIIQLQIWDTAGQETFKAVTQQYFRGAIGAMLIYDISKKSTFQSCEQWLQMIKDYGEKHTQILLVGNKCDLINLRAVSLNEACDFAQACGIQYIEVSALEDVNIDTAFTQLVSGFFKNKINKIKQNKNRYFYILILYIFYFQKYMICVFLMIIILLLIKIKNYKMEFIYQEKIFVVGKMDLVEFCIFYYFFKYKKILINYFIQNFYFFIYNLLICIELFFFSFNQKVNFYIYFFFFEKKKKKKY
ncbi:Ras-related protein Rab11c, putative [Ichthyophthirius multifiliis]|uniref:Ras-related protein Rab11c, putative n=1 Tax=Ichthyophthirius multifiliis TaxID=5932 RepID=G0QKZ4_ICHMU|nr:Ras-related protein Rab11c, putative [Ichthyophthirius multifiliis]EGR34115.1 Ras-related protein Rab11c, putative [Ichthyophthirius multifiliis]|eukprot:XP_004039419.1 Ras-related protein Rab11c, putative [Ichthyophthirius multifiliis]